MKDGWIERMRKEAMKETVTDNAKQREMKITGSNQNHWQCNVCNLELNFPSSSQIFSLTLMPFSLKRQG